MDRLKQKTKKFDAMFMITVANKIQVHWDG